MVEHERRNRNRAVANRGVVGVWLDAFAELLLVQPVIAAAAGIGARLAANCA